MTRIRWSGNDRYFGPFTYSRDSRGYRPLAIMFGSGDDDDYPGCNLRSSAFGHTLIIALPAVIKAWRQWVPITTEPTRSQMIASNRKPGYWDTHAREFGFTVSEGSLHVHYGPQTHDSQTSKSKCYFLPWRSWRHIRRSFYDLDGEHFATIPERKRRLKIGDAAWRNACTVEDVIQNACPTIDFEFDDYDGERITATTRIEEREWLLGEGWFKWLSLFRRPKVSRSLDIRFSAETGQRKGSWKGGTVGHSISMLPGELHDASFRRYCAQNQMVFVGPPPAPKIENSIEVPLP